MFFQWFGAPEGRKVGSLKRRVRSQLARWEMKNCTPLWREAHFEVKMYKTHHSRTTFGSWDVEKVHAVVARSTFRSQNVQNTPLSDHFWKLRCRKSARRCGAKHISKSKCTKHKTHHSRTTFKSWDVEKVHAVVARSTFRNQNVQNTTCSRHFWKLRCRKSGRRCGAKHISKSKCTKHTIVGPLLEVEMSKKCTPLWHEAHFEVKMLKTPWGSDHFCRFRCHFASLRFTTIHYITLHYTPLHYTTSHYTTLHNTTTIITQLHSTTLHYTKLHYTTLHYTTLLYTTLHYIPLHFTTLHYTTTTTTEPHSTTLRYTTLHYATLHYTTLPSTTLHYSTLHSTTLQLHLRLHNYTPLRKITLHYTTLHYTTLHSTTLHYTILHYTTLHYTTLHYTEWHCSTDRQVDR